MFSCHTFSIGFYVEDTTNNDSIFFFSFWNFEKNLKKTKFIFGILRSSNCFDEKILIWIFVLFDWLKQFLFLKLNFFFRFFCVRWKFLTKSWKQFVKSWNLKLKFREFWKIENVRNDSFLFLIFFYWLKIILKIELQKICYSEYSTLEFGIEEKLKQKRVFDFFNVHFRRKSFRANKNWSF